MFGKVTCSLLHRTDQDGTLIAVSRLNDSEKLKPLAVVMKCPGTRFWQRTKYKTTDFSLNDLLLGKPIQPVLSENVFLNNYEVIKKGSVAGSGEVDMAGVSVKAQGHGASKLSSSLGRLSKESVAMQAFLEDSKDRKVDLQHNLIMQLQGKNQIFTLVKERIFTTRDCKINVSELKEGSFRTLCKALSPAQVHLYNSICLKSARDDVLEIPPQTVLAYSVSELNITSDGHYEVGVSHDGIEEDDSYVQQFTDNEVEVDSLWAQTRITEGCPLSALNKELASVKEALRELACLSPETRFSLLNLFQKILPDQALLFTLEDKLEKLCDGPTYDACTYLPDSSNELTENFLALLQSETDHIDGLPTRPNGSLPETFSHNRGRSAAANWKAAATSHDGSPVQSTNQRQLILSAIHMLISAAVELTNDDLALLKTFSSETINGLNELVTLLTNSSQCIPFSELPFHPRDGELPEEVELLFILSNITLKRDNKELYAEIGSGSKVRPLVLCIVIHGLAHLNDSCEIDT